MALIASRDAARATKLDMVEKVLVSILLAVLAARLVPDALGEGNALPLLLVGSEAIVVAFVLLRRRTQDISLNWQDWLFGLAGTVAPLLVMASSGKPIVPIELCATLMILGISFNLWAKMTLRRSFGVVAANRGVKISGPYRLVRHPMYAGYTLTQIGFLLSGPTLWNFCIYALALGLQIARMRAEERVLMKDPAYSAMAQRVRFRLLPLVY
jgi:protein-S-isoprenylcysteine O-methyltransferase Ste14